MPQVDIPGSLQPPKFDPLATIGNLSALQQTLLQNRMLGQQVRGREAFGAATQRATGENGEIDTHAAMRELSGNPDAAYVAPEAAAQMQQLRALQAATQTALAGVPKAELEAFAANAAPVEGVVRGLVQNSANAPLTKEYATASLHRDLAEGGLLKTPEAQHLYQAAVSQLTDDPARNLDVLRSIGVRLGGPIDQYLGAVQTQNTGPALVQTQTPILGGPMVVRGALTTGLTPGEAAQPVPAMIRNPDGSFSPSAVPLAEFGEMSKQGPVATAPPLSPQGLTPANLAQTVTVKDAAGQDHVTTLGALLGQQAEGATPNPRNGRYPGAAPAAAPTAATSEVPGDLGVTGLAPGTASTMEASAKLFQEDTAGVPAVRRTLAAFDQASEALAKAQTGPGSSPLQILRGISGTYGIPLNPDATDAYAEANKWLSSALTQEASRLGLSTDQARALAAEAQPGVHTVHDAAVKMLPVLRGLKAMELAAPVIAQKEGVTPQQYSAWRANWANGIDPLAFSAAEHTKAERGRITARMSDAERARYAAGVRAAVEAGIFSAQDLAK